MMYCIRDVIMVIFIGQLSKQIVRYTIFQASLEVEQLLMWAFTDQGKYIVC